MSSPLLYIRKTKKEFSRIAQKCSRYVQTKKKKWKVLQRSALTDDRPTTDRCGVVGFVFFEHFYSCFSPFFSFSLMLWDFCTFLFVIIVISTVLLDRCVCVLRAAGERSPFGWSSGAPLSVSPDPLRYSFPPQIRSHCYCYTLANRCLLMKFWLAVLVFVLKPVNERGKNGMTY